MKVIILLVQIAALSAVKPGSVPPGFTEENVALRGKATQSGLLSGSGAAYAAIDGNRDPDFRHGSCAHTSISPNSWWRVDLLRSYLITSVTITNRRDCCGDRINGAQILIGDSLENNGINNARCSKIETMTAGETKTFPCPGLMLGRYVTVHLPGANYLQLCEVEVNVLLPPANFCG
ncbi:fucolectin-1-like [Conger conger]|uniref:fucolectin-1-like n=1 Tax=Conger conger TaxID=82655 RepID=UPI002A5A5643|nr:fucolectin-1-like [Conger conger]XP_061090478.1 fucolectin-1-like [Conger conger]